MYSMTRCTSMPHDAVTITVGPGVVDAHRELAGAKPPKTTECTAPSRAQASIATTASGTIGM